jgi:predicted acetyltransferase
MELSIPNIKYKNSFLEALAEIKVEGKAIDILNLDIESLKTNFDDYVRKLIEHSAGNNLPEGWVAHSTYWIMDSAEYIGTIDLRHSLTPALEKYGGHVGYQVRPTKRKRGYGTKALKMLLPIASKLGLKKILITCNPDNIGSIKVIESNSGILQDEIQDEERNILTRRYWIETH